MIRDIDTLLDQAYTCIDSQEPQRACQLFRQVTDLAPENAEAWLMLGALEGEAGHISAALPSVERAIELDPNYHQARLTLAHLYRQLGQTDMAIAQAREAARIDTRDSEVWLLLSGLYGQSGQYVAAEDAAANALKHAPDSVQALVNLAGAQRGLGKLDQAVDNYHRALNLDSHVFEALIGVGNTLLALSRPGDALEPLTRATKAAPGNAEAHSHLGQALLATGNANDALSEFREAVRLKPTAVRHLDVATALEYSNHHLEAAKYLGGPLQPDTDADRRAYDARAAAILYRAGDSQAARALLQPQIESKTFSPEAIEIYSQLCEEFGSCEEAADLLERAISSTDVIDPEIRRRLLFALGQLRDRQARFDAAFAAFEQANGLSAASYLPEAQKREVDRLIRVLDRERVATLPTSAQSNERPIFIVGMPRSGAALVEQVLASHPSVYGGGDFYGIASAVRALETKFGMGSYPDCLSSSQPEVLERLTLNYLAALNLIDNTASRITDRMLDNFQHLVLIRAMFPKAAIIHVTRDPLDTCLSCFSTDFAGRYPYSAKLSHLGLHYRQYQRLMAHYREALGISMFEVAYEALVSEPARTLATLLEYCGLPWSDACLKPHENSRVVRTVGYGQVSRPIHTHAVGRWKDYDKHLSELKIALAG